jgi:hypothetical protein
LFQEGLVELAWTDTQPTADGRHPLRHARLFGTDKLDELVEEAARLNSQPMCNVYLGAALRKPFTARFGRAQDSEAYALTAAYVDLDDPGAADKAREIYGPDKPTLVVVTGRAPHTRAQLWWRLEEPLTDPTQWPALIKAMAAKLDGDSSVSNASRVMRLAGTIAWPVKPGRSVELTSIAPLRQPGPSRFSAEYLRKVFPLVEAPPRAPQSEHKTSFLGMPPLKKGGFFRRVNERAMQDLASWVPAVFGADAIHQHGTGAWRICSKALGRDLEEDLSIAPSGIVDFGVHDLGDARQGKRTPIDIIIEHRQASNPIDAAHYLCGLLAIKPEELGWEGKAPEEPKPEEPKTIESIPLKSAFPIVEASIPPRDWIIPGLFLRQKLSVLVAPPGSGKSLLTLQLAIAIVCGMSWGGWIVRKAAKVLIVNAEDDIHEMQRRLVAAAREMGISQEQLAGRILLAENPESIVIARTDSRTKTVVRTPLLEQLVKTIADNEIGVTLVDPFAETFEGDENSNSEVKWAGILWREVARRTNSSLMLVHHTRKYANAMAGEADASRGGGALIGTARILSTLFSMTEEEAKATEIAPEDRPRYVRFDDAKANLSLVTGRAKWFEKRTIKLNNGTGLVPGDEVGVLVPWQPPGMLEGVSMFTIGQILDTIDRGLTDQHGAPSGQYYTLSASGPSKDRWAGVVVMRFVGCDEDKAKRILKEWQRNEVLETFNYDDPISRKERSGTRSVLGNRPDRKSL